jgi:hypothetical protein
MTSFTLIYDAFLRLNGLFLALLSLVVGFLLWALQPSGQIPMWLAIPTIVTGMIISFVLYDALSAAINNWGRAPGVRRVKEAEPLPEGNKGFRLIIEPSQQFYTDSMITLYGRENEFDIQLGIGYVETVNEKRYIQAIVYENPMNANRQFWERICNNDQEYLSRLSVRPSVPRSSYFS